MLTYCNVISVTPGGYQYPMTEIPQLELSLHRLISVIVSSFTCVLTYCNVMSTCMTPDDYKDPITEVISSQLELSLHGLISVI